MPKLYPAGPLLNVFFLLRPSLFRKHVCLSVRLCACPLVESLEVKTSSARPGSTTSSDNTASEVYKGVPEFGANTMWPPHVAAQTWMPPWMQGQVCSVGPTPGYQEQAHQGPKCYRCGQFGHFQTSSVCPFYRPNYRRNRNNFKKNSGTSAETTEHLNSRTPTQ